MEDEIKSDDTVKKSRSLNDIANLFINYLKSQNGNEVDLSQIEKALNISKRRLYDVINVLEGIGVIERGGKSKIRWVEESNFDKIQTTDEGPTIQQLLEYEHSIDEKIQAISNSFSNILSTPENKPYLYIPANDFNTLSLHNPNNSRFVLSGPPDLQIEISDDINQTNNLKIVGTSKTGSANIIPLNDQNN
ncbi:hypothetical protein M9Y10_022820 [Tritrichomonas musculus]|uniref:E2F/DP family winged-helix DNA-binding domain-containing protein n=1 Tax=Tritrichomonas musculus TaxID=1915356 RepID=A0ABR2KTF8_9EUKA